jgi:hypothetical protein
VGAEWHKFARSVDLYVNIKGRRTAILQDPVLSDVSSA